MGTVEQLIDRTRYLPESAQREIVQFVEQILAKYHQSNLGKITPPPQVIPIRTRLNQIMGRFAHPRPAVSPNVDKARWHEHLTEKYMR
jgi:hypothetical protein